MPVSVSTYRYIAGQACWVGHKGTRNKSHLHSVHPNSVPECQRICHNDSINFVLAAYTAFKACHACKRKLASMFACTRHKCMLMSPTRSITSDTNQTYAVQPGTGHVWVCAEQPCLGLPIHSFSS